MLSVAARDPKRAAVIEAISAANGRCVVPTAVRGEAHWDRTDPAAARANRLVTRDDALDSAGANRVAQLRSLVPTASVVDAAVATAADRIGGGAAHEVVEVLTSDVSDLTALKARLRATVDVVRL